MRTALPLIDRQIEVARDRGRHVAHLGGQVAAHLHGKSSVLDVAVDRAAAANGDQLANEHLALQRAVNVGAIDLYLAEAAAAGLHDKQVARDVAFDVAEDLDAAAVADLALEEGVFSDDEYARSVVHGPVPVTK